MHRKESCKCQHCGDIFAPDARNRRRQRYCRKAPCRKASKADSQQRWLKKPKNTEYFRDAGNVARVQQWRQAHPGYWRRSPRRKVDALQDVLIAQATEAKRQANQDEGTALQDVLAAQSPVVVGLIAHLTGTTLQEDIAWMTRQLHSRGRAVLGTHVRRPDYGKTHHRNESGAARAAPL